MSYVPEIISGCSSRPIPELANDLTKPIHEAAKSDDDDALQATLWDAWQAFVKSTAQIHHSEHDKIIDLLQETRQRSEAPTSKSGEKSSVWGREFEWQNLPLFGSVLRESWNTHSEEDPVWPNLNAFAARLTSICKTPNDSFDYSLYGIWALRSALEDQSPEQLATPSHRYAVQAAATWFVYAPEVLYDKALEGYSYDGKYAAEGQSLKGKNWTGYNRERWGIWKERFAGAKKQYSNDEETKSLVEKALKNIEEVEKKKPAPAA